MRMAGIHPLNPPPIQSQNPHFVPSDQCAGPPITVKRPDPTFKRRAGGARLFVVGPGAGVARRSLRGISCRERLVRDFNWGV
jgi:hypothetical protein